MRAREKEREGYQFIDNSTQNDCPKSTSKGVGKQCTNQRSETDSAAKVGEDVGGLH